MNENFFGDERDFRKYLLLKTLLENNRSKKFLVAWYLTEEESNEKKNRWSYLDSSAYINLDAELSSWLKDCVKKNDTSKINCIENKFLYFSYNITFYTEPVPKWKKERERWFNQLKDKAQESGVVFLDPDTGINFDSKRNSIKHVYINEIVELWESGKSLIVFNYFPRINHEIFVYGTMMAFLVRIPDAIVKSIYEDKVAYFFILQRNDGKIFENLKKGIENMSNRVFKIAEINLC